MRWSKSKYKAVKTEVDGITFDSKKEAKRYSELKILEKAGHITHLELQPVYSIDINGRHICNYLGDFRYFTVRDPNRGTFKNEKGELQTATMTQDPEGQVLEDCKGFRTDIYKLKKKLVEALYPGTIIKET